MFSSKTISVVNRCICLLFHEAAPIQSDRPNQTFWECIPCSHFHPFMPAVQCQGLFSSTPHRNPLWWSKEQNRKWAMTPSPNTWVSQLAHGFMLTSTVTCLTRREKDISAVPNQLSASLVIPASSANQLKRKWYQAQPIHWNDCSRRNYYPVIIQIIMFTLFLSFFPINFSTNFIQNMLWKEKRGVEGEGEGRRLFPGWQAEAHPSWSCEIFWLKMDSCKHVAKGHKCISR